MLLFELKFDYTAVEISARRMFWFTRKKFVGRLIRLRVRVLFIFAQPQGHVRPPSLVHSPRYPILHSELLRSVPT